MTITCGMVSVTPLWPILVMFCMGQCPYIIPMYGCQNYNQLSQLIHTTVSATDVIIKALSVIHRYSISFTSISIICYHCTVLRCRCSSYITQTSIDRRIISWDNCHNCTAFSQIYQNCLQFKEILIPVQNMLRHVYHMLVYVI